MRETNQKGFTLIELLIVIVIIGILAGVLISVIDPTSQQNRARDAGIKASINKVVLATEGYISAYGDAPGDIQFFGQFKNNTVSGEGTADGSGLPGTSCAGTGGVGDDACFFKISGNRLPDTCSLATGGVLWYGEVASGGQCYFYYNRTAAGQFAVYAKAAGLADTVFKFENTGSNAGMIQHCAATDPTDSGNCTNPTP